MMHNLSRINLILFLSWLLFTGSELKAQLVHKVLFLGNSYTNVNNLPQLVHDVALSAGDTLIFDSYAPGGYTLEDHSTDAITIGKLMVGDWEYVVLQEQSQRPITNTSKFKNFGFYLDKLITQHDFCGGTMLYMTWGRKNGDASNCASFPVMCTYNGMDSTLRNNYLDLASDLRSEVSPVSVVWNYLRKNHPGIELYQTDESHPSAAGSYAAACCFYASIFKKDPTLITFNFGLTPTDASIIKNAAKTMVFNQPNLWDFRQAPTSHFWYEIGAGINEIHFININVAEEYFRDFGDGTTSNLKSPTHSYLSNGTYTVTLTTAICDVTGYYTNYWDTTVTFCSHTPTIYTANPWVCQQDTLWTQSADMYQWFSDRRSIPETKQYVVNYLQYGSGFSVLSTKSGCSELSRTYSFVPEWSGYYFDIWPGSNPCEGDTTPFTVLHTNGFLSGSEIIRWYKNGLLLSQLNDGDTLWITEEGNYECKVVDPNNVHCPLDTTSYLYELDCGPNGIVERDYEEFWEIFPNPASEVLTIQFIQGITQEQVQIYNATGHLVKILDVSTTTTLNITDLPSGLYYIRLKDNKQPALRFIRQ